MPDRDDHVSNPPRRRRPGLWILLALVVVVGLAFWLWPRGSAQAQPSGKGSADGKNTAKGANAAAGKKGGRGGANAAVPVSASKAYRGDIPVYQTGLGTVAAFYTVTVRSRVDGQLMNVYVREGDFVKQGQLLAQIDPRPFQVQLEQAQGTMARDQATLANARLDLTRYQTLIEQEAIPKQQLDTQKSTVAQLEGTVKQDQSAIDSANLQLTYSRVTAPISGRIGLRQVDPGNIVSANDTTGMLVITQLQPDLGAVHHSRG